MIQDRLWFLMSRRLSGEASPEEMEELQALISQSPDKQYLLDILHSYFQAASSLRPDSDIDAFLLEQRFNRIVQETGDSASAAFSAASAASGPASAADQAKDRHLQIVDNRRRPITRKLARIAAAAVVIVLGFWLAERSAAPAISTESPDNKGGEIVSLPGVRTKLLLPDGTQVVLNSNSRLTYSAAFNNSSREVELEGEAYFDVAKDAGHPFVVHTTSIAVKVLGTAFTVKSYPADETVETTLLRGAIEVSRPGNPNAPRILLKPNEKLVVNLQTIKPPVSSDNHTRPAAINTAAIPDISVNPISANLPDSEKEETSWVYNRLTFNGETFKELASRMERWYNVHIIFKDDALYKYHFGGTFANESITEALDALKLTAPFDYKINGNEIQLYAR